MARFTYERLSAREPAAAQPQDRFCKACRYCWGATTSECLNDELLTWDPVKGKQRSSCADNRKEGGKCGPEGKLWEARLPAPPVPWPLWLLLGGLAVAALYHLVFT